jgi:antirestriction protein
MTDATRIYVACLASYNNGVLHGRWIDCEGKDASELQRETNAMLKASRFPNVTRRQCVDCEHIQSDAGADDECDECGGALSEPFPSAEEWAIHDHEGFGGLVGESTGFDDVAAVAEALNDGESSAFAVHWLIEDRGFSISDACEKASDVVVYQSDAHDLAADYAQEWVEECYSEQLEALPSILRYSIDWERVARDLKLGGDIDEGEAFGERFLVTNASEF